MSDGKSLVNIDLTKPLTTFIEKCANAAGVLYEPTRIKRKAEAEGKALIIKAQADIVVSDLQQRTYERLVREECIFQRNMEEIQAKAIPLIEDNSDPAKMEDDWVARFFNDCRHVSDEDMQILFARVFAGEANSPGTFSKRCASTLLTLDKKDAALFRTLCGFMWTIGEHFLPFIEWMPQKNSIFVANGIDRDALFHLHTIGLITLIEWQPQVFYRDLEAPTIATYFGRVVQLNLELRGGKLVKQLHAGVAHFTEVGAQLASICGAEPIEGVFDTVVDKWKIHAPSLPWDAPK